MGNGSIGSSTLAWAAGALLALVVAWLVFRILVVTLVLGFKLGLAVLLVAIVAFLVINLSRRRNATSWSVANVLMLDH